MIDKNTEILDEEYVYWLGYKFEINRINYEVISLQAFDENKLKFNIKNLTTNIADQLFVTERLNYAFEAQEKFQEKDFEKALEFSNIALKINPDDVVALNIKAMCFSNMNQVGAAIKLFEETIFKFPNIYYLHSNLGMIYYDIDQYEQAEKNLIQAHKLDETEISTIINLGRLYGSNKRFEDALFYFHKVEELNPDVRVKEFVNDFIEKTQNLLELEKRTESPKKSWFEKFKRFFL